MSETCKSCPASIRWAVTKKKRRMPLDPEPSVEGNVQLHQVNGVDFATVLAGEPLEMARQAGIPLFTSHLATCPNAARHRQRRGGRS